MSSVGGERCEECKGGGAGRPRRVGGGKRTDRKEIKAASLPLTLFSGEIPAGSFQEEVTVTGGNI